MVEREAHIHGRDIRTHGRQAKGAYFQVPVGGNKFFVVVSKNKQ